MFFWHSENEPTVYPVNKDPYNIKIDDDNGIIIIASYEATGSRTTTLLFHGPNAKANADKWNRWNLEENTDENSEERIDLNVTTREAISVCFGN